MNQTKTLFLTSIIFLFLLRITSAQVEFDQIVNINDMRLNMNDSPIWFYDDAGDLKHFIYLDDENDFWVNLALEIKQSNGDLHLHSQDLYIEGDVGQIHSDPDKESSDLELKSNRYVIAHVDANQPNFNGEAENGRFIVKGGDGHESIWVTESGGLIVWQQTDPDWTGFGQSTINSSAGIDIVPQQGIRTEMYSADSDLCFAFGGLDRSYIDDATGKYYNASNSAGGGAIVSDVTKNSGKILNEVLELPIYRSTSKSSIRDVDINASVLAKKFPSTVEKKGGEYAISYSDFGLIAIKAIQEQQVMIEELRAEIEILKKNN